MFNFLRNLFRQRGHNNVALACHLHKISEVLDMLSHMASTEPEGTPDVTVQSVHYMQRLLEEITSSKGNINEDHMLQILEEANAYARKVRTERTM